MEVHPIQWVDGNRAARAADALVRYLRTDSGRYFEVFAGQGDPHHFVWSDLAAVASLSVNVPAGVADWLILGDGADETSGLLAGMGNGCPDANLADHDLVSDEAAKELWAVLRRQGGMGPTTTMTLMAAKRPHLVPIYDE